jgi:hypothetical protein
MLPVLTLISHLIMLFIAILYTPSIASSWTTLWFSFYNVIAIGASMAGLIGILRVRLFLPFPPYPFFREILLDKKLTLPRETPR